MEACRDYLIKAYVRDFALMGRIRETDAPAEGHITLEVKVKNSLPTMLECFLDYDDSIAFFAKKYSKGDTVSIKLRLGGDYTNPIRLSEKTKQITWIEHPPLLNSSYVSEYYLAKGQIVELRQHPEMQDSNLLVVDCGIYVYTRVIKTAPLKVGDYLQMEGRLDASIVGKVN